MKIRHFGIALVYAAIGVILIGSGCTVKKKGVAHENAPPKAFFSTVPIASTVFTKPDQLFWYATDRDGYVIEFQYALIPESLIGVGFTKLPEFQRDSVVLDFLRRNAPNSSNIWEVFKDTLRRDTLRFEWVSVDNVNRNGQTDTVELPSASRNAADTATRPTEVFVRARDDRGALSTDPLAKILASIFVPTITQSERDSLFRLNSPIAWRNFGRKNRPPSTYFRNISVCNRFPIAQVSEPPILYSLDGPTYNSDPTLRVGYCGITINYEGADSLDYPNQEQPPFEYFWELFGPFRSADSANFLDSNRLWASTAYPLRWPGPGSGQSPKKRVFTSAKSFTFYGLTGYSDDPSKRYSDTSSIRPGYYRFRVRAKDDAEVIDSFGATVTFGVVRPRFDRDVLLITKLTFSGGPTLKKNGQPDGSIPFLDVDSTGAKEAGLIEVQNYYLRLIRNAGYGSVIDSAQDVKVFDYRESIPESLLARYKLVIFHKEKMFHSDAPTTMQASLKAYMDAGGSVWGLGRDDLSDAFPIYNVPAPVELPFNQTQPNTGVGYFYFGAREVFTHAHVNILANDSVTLEEFAGADPGVSVVDEGFPRLDVDDSVLGRFTVVAVRRDTTPYRQVPAVNYFVREGARSEEVYKFRSPVGVADTSHLNGKGVALRSDRGIFKSAYFGFSLFGIKEAQATCAMSRMLKWFLGYEPPGGPPPCCPGPCP
ncbi:MAG: hypothetical protein L0196_02175 [candidate division Zixibacteria bacterium]|nr:hypothetical protein [candidate division Zixibacteria bacterium]